MILLDTDHFSVYTDERDARRELLNTRMEAATQPIACSIVSVEEVLRGWLAIIHRLRDVHRQLPAQADRQIDNLVYELYGLTDEEIKIVEGGVFVMASWECKPAGAAEAYNRGE